MGIINQYLETLAGYLHLIEEEEALIDEAATLMAEVVRNNRLIHVFGTDPHSASIGDELFFKGGGLIPINPIYDPAFSLSHGAYRCCLSQTLDGLAPVILDYYENIEAGDTILIISNDIHNIVFNQAVKRAKEKGLTVIVLASVYGEMKPEVAADCDVLINNCSPEDDCVLECSGVKTAGISTVLSGIILNILMAKTIAQLENPPVWQGCRTAGMENIQLIYKNIEKIKHL